MIQGWNEIIASPEYLQQPIQVREAIRKKWFDENVAVEDEFQKQGAPIQQAIFAKFNAESEAAESYAKAPDERGLIADTLSHFARGSARAIGNVGSALGMADLTPQEEETEPSILDRAGQAISDWSKDAMESPSNIPSREEQRGEYGFIKRGVMGGVESTPMMAAPFVAGGAATLVGGPVAGAAVGTGTLAATFGLGTYGEEYSNVLKELERTRPDLKAEQKKEIAHKAAFGNSAFEVGTELVSDLAALVTFGGSKALVQPLKATIKNLTQQSAKELLKSGVKQAGVETASEMVAGGGQNWVRQSQGLIGGTIAEGAAESIIPALTMSLFMGVGGAGMNRMQSRAIMSDLNADNPETRFKAANYVASQIAKNTKDAELAKSWQGGAMNVIQNGGKFNFDEKIVDFATTKTLEDLDTETKAADITQASNVDEAAAAFKARVNQGKTVSLETPGFEQGPEFVPPAPQRNAGEVPGMGVGESWRDDRRIYDAETETPMEAPQGARTKIPTRDRLALPPGQGFELLYEPDYEQVEGQMEAPAGAMTRIPAQRRPTDVRDIVPLADTQRAFEPPVDAEYDEDMEAPIGAMTRIPDRTNFPPDDQPAQPLMNPGVEIGGRETPIKQASNKKAEPIQGVDVDAGSREGDGSSKRFPKAYVDDLFKKNIVQPIAESRIKGFSDKLGIDLDQEATERLMVEMMQQGKERGDMMLIGDASPSQPDWAIQEAWAAVSKQGKPGKPQPPQTKRQQAKQEYQDFVNSLTPEQLEQAKGVIPDKAPTFPGAAIGRIKKMLAATPQPGDYNPSGLQPTATMFNTPPERFQGYGWRTMGKAEFDKLMAGQKTYGGKAAGKGNFVAPTPESAGTYARKGKYLVEFAGVEKAEGETVSNAIGKPNVTSVKVFDGKDWVSEEEYARPKPKEAKPKKTSTLRGRIKAAGGIDFLNFKGELKEMPQTVRIGIARKTGTPIDLLERTLRDEGWLDKDEKLLDVLRDVEVLKRGKVITNGLDDAPETDYQRQQREKFEADMNYEPEEPPPGKYVMMDAGKLPEGKTVTIIDGNGRDGWDEYKVIDKDETGVVLEDGTTVYLQPGEQVQVRVEDLDEAPDTDVPFSTRTLDTETGSGDNKATNTKEAENGLFLSPKWSSDQREGIGAVRSEFYRIFEGKYGPGIRTNTTFAAPITSSRKNLKRLGKEFGLEVHFFRTTQPGLIGANGLTLPSNPNAIFINVNADAPVLAVAGHELLHTLQFRYPRVYEKLYNALKSNTKAFDEYYAKLSRNREKAGHKALTKEQAFNELLADFTGDQISRPEFYEKLIEKDPSFAVKLINIIKKLLADFDNAIRKSFGSEKHFKDLDLARGVLADVLSGYKDLIALEGDTAKGEAAFQTAYHGTPHIWPPEPGFPHGRPRLDKIGTGEGGAAYGWGWYSADTEDTAKHYKDDTYSNRTTHGGDVWKDFSSKFQKAADAFAEDINRFSKKELSDDALGIELEGFYRSGGNHRMIESDTKSMLEQAATDGYVLPPQNDGSLYALDIPDEVMPKLLDWDAPVPIGMLNKIKLQAAKNWSKDLQDAFNMRMANNDIANNGKGFNGQNVYKAISNTLGSDREASRFLADAGIPGNTHGGMSKGATGVKYVIWNQSVLDKIALLKRNGEKLDAIREADAAMATREDQTQTEAFRRWFGKSKVVEPPVSSRDKSQRPPMAVFHATMKDFDAFKIGESGYNSGTFGSWETKRAGIFFSEDPEAASVYAEQGGETIGGRVIKAYLSIQNPLYLDEGFSVEDIQKLSKHGVSERWMETIRGSDIPFIFDNENGGFEFVDAAKKAGYDGAFFVESNLANEEPHNVWVAFNPTQIKSATGNRGTFDPTNPDIRFSTREAEQEIIREAATGLKFVKKFWQNRKTGWRQGKEDNTVFNLITSVPSFWKNETMKKVFNSALERPDEYYSKFNEMTTSPEGASDVKTIETFKKTNKSEYRKLRAYLKHRDQNQIGYRVVNDKNNDEWHVKDLSGNTIYTTDKESDAISHSLSLERQDFVRGGNSDQAADALVSVRRITHRGFDALIKGIRSLEKAYNENGMELPQDLQTALNEMGDMRSFYMPRSRKSGRYKLIARKEGANPKLEFFDSDTMMTVRQTQLENQGYTVEKDKSGKMPEDVFDMAKQAVHLQSIIDEGLKRVENEQSARGRGAALDDVFRSIELDFSKALVEQVSNIIKERGFRSHMVKRSDLKGLQVYEGYEEDPLISITKYARSIAAGEAKKNMALKMVRAFTGTDESWRDYKKRIEDETGEKADYLDYKQMVDEKKISPTKQPVFYREGMSYIQEMLRNEEFSDRVIGQIKGLAVMKYLAGRVISAPLVNLTALVTSAPAAINNYAKVPLRRTFRLIGNGIADYASYKRKKTDGIDKWTLKAIQHIETSGWHTAQYNKEALSILRSKIGNGWDTVLDKLMFTFGASEQLNRVGTILAAYNGIKEKASGAWTEADHIEALDKAKKASDRAHGTYGKEDYPYIARGANPAAQIMRMFYVFRKFSHNYLLTMKEVGMDDKNAKAALYMALSPAVIAGAGATVLMPVIQAIGKAIGYDDPEEEIYKAIENQFGKTTEQFARLGLAGLGGYGINMKGSLSIGVGDIPTTIWDVLGAPGSVITDIYEGGENILKGNVMKGAEKMLPLFLGNPIKAVREYTEGVTTRVNTPVFYGKEQLKNTPLDAAYRFLSFNPARISTIREKQWKEKKTEYKFRDDRADINAKIKKFYLQPIQKRNKADWIDILAEIEEYNVRAKRKGFPPVTGKSIRQLIKRSFKPSKKERERVTED